MTSAVWPDTRQEATIPQDWMEAVARRDRSHDGRFVYGVRTTGIYCRAGCPSRAARPENLLFFATPAEAEAAGLRACRRCRPDEEPTAAAAIRRACQLIRAAERPLPLAELSRSVGLSARHFHRMFTRATGVSPRAYAEAERARRLVERLPAAATVTEALYDAGYESASRFYAAAGARLGMTPGEARRGGAGVQIRFVFGQTSLGALLVAMSRRGVCAILLGDDQAALLRTLEDRFPRAELLGGGPEFEEVVAQVAALVERPHDVPDLPLDIAGTAFQQRVWQALRNIPPGATSTYARLAEIVGSPSAHRAVAAACAANVLAVAIPCHRAVRSDGALAGYRWGLARKQELLRRERSGAGREPHAEPLSPVGRPVR